VIKHLKSIFARHGIPEVVMSDNGPQYASEQFTKFTHQYGFTHVTSSPKYPQSNGAAERAVRTIKQMLSKNQTGEGDVYMALLAYRSTPLENGWSPAELLMGRKLRTTLPIIPQQLKPKIPNTFQLQRYEKQARNKQKQNFDKCHRAVKLKPLKTGDTVWLPEMQKKGRVIHPQGIHSYLIKTKDGGIYHGNRQHLKFVLNTNHFDDQEETEDPDVTYKEPVSILPDNSLNTQDQSPWYQTRSGRNARPPSWYGET